MNALPWPKFWSHVPESDRQGLREVLGELLRHGVILGDESSGRDRYQLVRDYLREEVAEYLAPLGLRLIVVDDPPIIQARPVPEECDLIRMFTREETLIALVLWLMYDEALIAGRSKVVLVSADDLAKKWAVIFPRIEGPSIWAMKEALKRLKQKRLVRTTDAEDPTKAGDLMIEILPTLRHAIDFDGLEEWQARATAFQSEGVIPTESYNHLEDPEL